MKYYFAPMEGITGYVHRNAHHKLFGHVNKYFTAFISTNQNGKLSSKEREDILPDHNDGIYTVPQLLTNSAHDFMTTAAKIKEFGYKEVNLNLGCPSKTVVGKCKGAGFLAVPELLEQFLDEIFEKTELEISIKTRLGMEEPEEFYRLLEIYNKFPIKELIIHPRTQKDFYKNSPNWEMFREAIGICRHDICYNGDIFTESDCASFRHTFPQTETVMIGRGLLINPGFTKELQTGEAVAKETLRAFHDLVYQGYQGLLFGEKPVLFKMKELWTYMIHLFEDPPKYGKKIKKAEHFDRYEEAVAALFSERNIIQSVRM